MKIKDEEQPHGPRLGRLKNCNPPCNLAQLPRCNALAKSTGKRCRQPAMDNGKCYWHGGKSTGPPEGNQNAFKHGQFTKESLAFQKKIDELMNSSRAILDSIEKTS